MNRMRITRETARSEYQELWQFLGCLHEDWPEMYKTFRDKKDGCIKVILKP